MFGSVPSRRKDVLELVVENIIRAVFVVAIYAAARGLFFGLHTYAPSWAADPYTMTVTVTMLIHTFCFWVPGAVLAAVDLTKWPASLYACKIQAKTDVTLNDYVECLGVVALNQVSISIPMAMASYPLFVWAGMDSAVDPSSFPGVGEIVIDLLICAAVEEVLFYYSHRLLHHRWFYQSVHAIHHRFRAPVALASEYAHPLEMVLSNAGPVMLGPVIAGAHVATFWMWMMIAILSTLHAHSGYDVRLSPFKPSRMHDYHHYAYLDNYGVLNVLDEIHGTNKQFKKFEARRLGVES